MADIIVLVKFRFLFSYIYHKLFEGKETPKAAGASAIYREKILVRAVD